MKTSPFTCAVVTLADVTLSRLLEAHPPVQQSVSQRAVPSCPLVLRLLAL